MKTKILFFLLSLAFTTTTLTYAQDKQTPIDGRKFKIDLMKDGKTESVETLIFNAAKLQTPDCEKYGFKEATSYVKQTEDYYTWASTVSSPNEGAMAWQGTVKGNKIEGTCIWRKKGQEPIHYTFSGTEIK